MTKKFYIQPEMQVAHIALDSMILAGSPAPSGDPDLIPINSTSTGEQW